jgi:tRNA pseudouridine55 synthase
MIQDLPKTYLAEITFGKSTTTYDSEGEVDEVAGFEHITRELILNKLESKFKGTIDQVPPMYSALKYGGKKLYELARKGETVERAPRQVTFHNFEILDFEPAKVTLKVQCSKGTYIRSLAKDLGEALDSKAYLSKLE